MQYVPGPDFPTGGIIYGREGIRAAPTTPGAADHHARQARDRGARRAAATAIIVTEIPYMVNKARWIEKTAELVREKKLEGISDIRDESDRDGMRVVFELQAATPCRRSSSTTCTR